MYLRHHQTMDSCFISCICTTLTVSGLNFEVLVKPHQPPVGSHSSCQNQKVNQKVNDVKVVFLVDLNIVTVHVVALTEQYNVKYIADLSAHTVQEKVLKGMRGGWALCCRRKTGEKIIVFNHICKAVKSCC